ncbi:endoplasmic reticulum membrane-associated RNA degradation protein-like isoform X2 [Dendronephthya gigantea]|uniref:endoplasmic reticulum membrane-associated RNA degradation protein-like isoform X2 n=1 Tax=Dendronephthya gigantea TaxID=151771 RepID=UPI00106CCF25|nr:endoplasmic reticulum membrane-associated RNA degradation protein-like isoform X2 [Dendronephthya gigantea]
MCAETVSWISQNSSYLSSNVKKLVCYRPDGLPQRVYYDLFCESGVLNWNAILKLCNLNECFPQDGVSDYFSAMSRLYPICDQVHGSIYQLTTEEFRLKYKSQLKRTGKSKTLLQCFTLLKSDQPGCLVTSLLLLTSTLERLLGDIFLTFSGEKTPCPPLLKDLLRTQELEAVLGKSFMRCLEVFIGPPCGLNLRNLAWHGFLSEGELPAQYVSFLLLLSLSMFDVTNSESRQPTKCCEKLNERPLIKYSEISPLRDVFPDITLTGKLHELFSRSDFVTNSMVPLWYLALDFFRQESYDLVAMILLPQLEHSLRRLYSSVNEMPERVETAESAEFYTTFNEILSPCLADGTPNKLFDSLDSCYIELLLDVLVHPEGPRLRDHLSHSEVDIQEFPKYLANHVLGITIAFCLRFCAKDFSQTVGFPHSFLTMDHFSKISKAVREYSSIFHPFSCLRRELSTMINSLTEWKNFSRPNENEFRENCSGDLCDVIEWKSIVDTILPPNLFGISSAQMAGESSAESALREQRSIIDEEVLKMISRMLNDLNLDTFFRPRFELEVVALLRQVVDNGTRTSIQQTSTARYSEWEAKILRSRKRNNYKRFWVHLPSIGQTLCLLSAVVVGEIINIEKQTGSCVRKNKFLKKCLQCSENLTSLSSSSKNRWLECKEVCTAWLDQVRNYFSQQNE